MESPGYLSHHPLPSTHPATLPYLFPCSMRPFLGENASFLGANSINCSSSASGSNGGALVEALKKRLPVVPQAVMRPSASLLPPLALNLDPILLQHHYQSACSRLKEFLPQPASHLSGMSYLPAVDHHSTFLGHVLNHKYNCSEVLSVAHHSLDESSSALFNGAKDGVRKSTFLGRKNMESTEFGKEKLKLPLKTNCAKKCRDATSPLLSASTAATTVASLSPKTSSKVSNLSKRSFTIENLIATNDQKTDERRPESEDGQPFESPDVKSLGSDSDNNSLVKQVPPKTPPGNIIFNQPPQRGQQAMTQLESSLRQANDFFQLHRQHHMMGVAMSALVREQEVTFSGDYFNSSVDQNFRNFSHSTVKHSTGASPPFSPVESKQSRESNQGTMTSIVSLSPSTHSSTPSLPSPTPPSSPSTPGQKVVPVKPTPLQASICESTNLPDLLKALNKQEILILNKSEATVASFADAIEGDLSDSRQRQNRQVQQSLNFNVFGSHSAMYQEIVSASRK